MRTIKDVITVTNINSQNKALRLSRVIGTIDIEGKGTSHSLFDVDPFIFLDDAFIQNSSSSSFKKHPHSGLIAVTYLLEGSINAWDNIYGDVPDLNHAGGAYCVHTGQGIVHGEKPVAGINKIRLLQLWIQSPLTYTCLPKASYQIFQPNEIPLFANEDFSVKVIIGEAYGLTSPVNTLQPLQYLHIKLKTKESKNFNIVDNNWTGFIYILNGNGQFGSNAINGISQQCLVLGNENSNIIPIQNTASYDLEFIIATGRPNNRPYVKLLGHGGAFITDTQEQARSVMSKYKKDHDNFGKYL